MKAAVIRSKTATEIAEMLISLRKSQFGLRMQKATQQLTDNSQIKKARKDVARVKTILHEKGMVK